MSNISLTDDKLNIVDTDILYPVYEAGIADYFMLMKPRVMALVVFTAFVGMMLYPLKIHPLLALVSLFSIALGAGASGALNMWYDADIDKLMQRTQKRPIPRGRISPHSVRDFGIVMSVLSVIMLALASNILAAFLLAFTIFFYVVIYTIYLKRSHVQNIVIGGLAGALPPVVASAASTGNITLYSILLCALIFIWTPPHFWSLALVKKEDYAKANIPMLPNVKGDAYTKKNILLYTFLLLPFTILPFMMGYAHLFYLCVSIALWGWFLKEVWNLFIQQDKLLFSRACWRSFFVSIVYLFGVFMAVLIENMYLRVM